MEKNIIDKENVSLPSPLIIDDYLFKKITELLSPIENRLDFIHANLESIKKTMGKFQIQNADTEWLMKSYIKGKVCSKAINPMIYLSTLFTLLGFFIGGYGLARLAKHIF